MGKLSDSLHPHRAAEAVLCLCGILEDDAVYIPYDADEHLALSDKQTFGGDISW